MESVTRFVPSLIHQQSSWYGNDVAGAVFLLASWSDGKGIYKSLRLVGIRSCDIRIVFCYGHFKAFRRPVLSQRILSQCNWFHSILSTHCNVYIRWQRHRTVCGIEALAWYRMFEQFHICFDRRECWSSSSGIVSRRRCHTVGYFIISCVFSLKLFFCAGKIWTGAFIKWTRWSIVRT